MKSVSSVTLPKVAVPPKVVVPENKLLRGWIKRSARGIVRRAGVRKIGDYYHPPEFDGKYRRYMEYFRYCLCLEREKLVRAQGQMSKKELVGLADSYAVAGTWWERQLILETAKAHGGEKNVEALARKLEIDPKEALKALGTFTKQRRRSRRQQRPVVVLPPPEPGSGRSDLKACEVAQAAAGGGNVRGQGRSAQTWDAGRRGCK